jgi:deazaflavin-dependent oxidoreductase (nitroreductase family)
VKIAIVAVAVLISFWFFVVPLFERFAPAEAVRTYQRLTMPFFAVLYGLVPRTAIVETTGRRTGLRRRVPVAARRSGNEVWVVAGAGRKARYVKNIEADPRVRVKIGGRWLAGTATIRPDDDARKRRYWVSLQNGLFLAIVGDENVSVRIDVAP